MPASTRWACTGSPCSGMPPRTRWGEERDDGRARSALPTDRARRAATHGGSTAVAEATPSGTVSNAMTATGAGMEPPGGYGYGGRTGLYGRGGDLTVTKVNSNTITATGRAGQTVTVQVSATTA